MMQIQPPPLLTATAEQLLCETFNAPLKLIQGEDLGGSKRSQVYRFQVASTVQTLPTSVIVKQANVSQETLQGQAQDDEWLSCFFNDWASLEFLHKIGLQISPCVYTGDPLQRLMVMEDLGTGQRLDQLLLGDNPVAAETALLDYARLHGQLHAATYGRQAEYQTLRHRFGHPTRRTFIQYDTFLHIWQETIETLQIKTIPGAEKELAQLVESLQHPGSWSTFVQGDACPDNCLYTAEGLKLIDFEGGEYTSALLEGVYGHMHFPTCWCVFRLPDELVQRMNQAYRTELSHGYPIAQNDTCFYQAMVEASVYWSLRWCQMVPIANVIERDRTLVALSDRRRHLLRFKQLAELIDEIGHLNKIGATVLAIYEKLVQLWPDEHEIPLYPAFRK